MSRKILQYLKLWISLSVIVFFTSTLLVSAGITEKHPNSNAEDRKVSGTITDATTGEPLIGVTVLIDGTSTGVISDLDGRYVINVPGQYEVLVFSYIGYLTQKVEISGMTTLNVKLEQDVKTLDEVAIVAFAKQKKSSVIASITTINPADLKIPSSNLTTSLAGRMSGIISYQRSGEPGQDNAQFFIRGVTTFGYKKDPLILIDGIELTTQDLARMQPDDIASFSILKDASATALYGARGANGVVYVTTKEGVEGPAKVSVRFENSISQPTRNIDLADPITYMKMGNEAVKTRDPLGILPYSLEKVEKTMAGADPVLYPTTDWYNSLFREKTTNQRFNMNISGGGKIARYYISTTVNQDNGAMKVDGKNNFNSNIKLRQFQLRSNMNINMTKSTVIKFTFNATLDNYRGPIDGGADLYKKVMRTNPVYFRPYYEPDVANEFTKHVLFGNYGTGNYLNPYADMVKGYKDYKENRVLAQMELNQDLSRLTKGLSFRVIGNGNQYSFFDISRFYNPYFYSPIINPETGAYTLSALNPKTGTEYLNYNEGRKQITAVYYGEAAIIYNRKFNEKHDVGGLIVSTLRDELIGNSGNLQKSLPYRNMGVSGRFTYGYNEKYFTEFNFGYNGSERFAKNNRFGFFPSIAVGWIMSNEEFFAPIKNTISKLKLKATYGLVGNDAIGGPDDRFFYLSQVNMNDSKMGGTFGKYFNYSQDGISIDRYANDQITWETAKKTNLGFELQLFNKLEIQADVFQDNRSNILMDRITLASMGLQAGVRANVGEAKGKGIDISINYDESIGTDWWFQMIGNFTYATSEITKVEEPSYVNTPWLSAVGYSIDQTFGYVAERLFIDQYEVNNSPEQSFGEYMAGDIKYKDINGDDRISGLDRVAIGFPTRPEIVYGAGFSMGYKSFDLSIFFQGLARESFWIDPYASSPFVGEQQLLQVWADSYWSEEHRDSYARWPRLSNSYINNNTQTNTWFMQNGAFLRLKSLELGFSLPKGMLTKMKIAKCRIYTNGTNLLTFSKFKLWDPEMGGNGLGYPIQKVINFGINVDF
jgi:TonB-linked SusC/RagA family outer membrane protein